LTDGILGSEDEKPAPKKVVRKSPKKALKKVLKKSKPARKGSRASRA
jgi:hypothetical protein